MLLNFKETGDPRGAPVVLLHAFPLSSTMWRPQIEALKEFRVIAPDFRGFGGTSLSAPWFIEHAVDDLHETLSARGVRAMALVGLSMGGYVALRFIEKYPSMVNGLALCDTRAEADANENKIKRAAAVDFVRRQGVRDFIGPFLKDALSPNTLKNKPEVVSFLDGIAEKASAEVVTAALAALAARPDMTGALAGIKVPTAVVVGEHDKLTPPALAESMAARIPNVRMNVVPEAGHFSNVENCAAFNDALVDFFRST